MKSRVSLRWMLLVSMASLGALGLGHSASAQDAFPVEPDAETARVEDTDAFVTVVFEGSVFEPDGVPAEGAVVVSSAGGKTVTDLYGRYRLEARVPLGAESVQITAVGQGGGNRLASTSVGLLSSGYAPVGPLMLLQGTTCAPSWLPTFGQRPGANSTVRALVVYDDGSGPALYAGGSFTIAPGSVPAARIAKWNGSSWAALGSGIEGGTGVIALTVYDDGSGPALYAGGSFSTAGGVAANNLAKWNGSTWASVGGGTGTAVQVLAVHDDGTGPALYVGGNFFSVGGVTVNHIAKWNGSTWAALGSGMSGLPSAWVLALTTHDDGSGPALYAGGLFTSAGGVTVNRIAKWDGSAWSALGIGMNNDVGVLTSFDDGSGPALYAGGSFTAAGGVAASRIAKWNGSTWAGVGGGMNSFVESLTVFNDGSGPALHAGGSFTIAGGAAANRIAKWNGSGWVALGNGMTDDGSASVSAGVDALTVFDDGSGTALYAGGFFSGAGAVTADRIAKWNGSSWSAFGGNGMGGGSPHIASLAVFDDGSGSALYAGGSFMGAGNVIGKNVAKWDGSSWAALGSGIHPESVVLEAVLALAVFDDGSGPALYAGGHFTSAGGVSANRIAKWNGSTWSALGSGVSGSSVPRVQSLAVFDDGSGPALYAGGLFTTAGGVAASNIAKWNGSSWAALGSGTNSTPDALTVFDDGSGPALYAGGTFSVAGGLTVNRVAKWNGSSWAALGVGVSSSVRALTVFDDGSGPALIAGGLFTTAGGASANRIAKWDGSSWSALGTGISHEVRALTVFDDGSGPELYAGGLFTTAGGTAANRIAKWDGSSWAALGGGISIVGSEGVHSLAVFDDGGGSALFAGGEFVTALDSGDGYLAKWACVPDTTPPVLSCPPSVLALDSLGGSPGEVVTFTVTATDDLDPSPVVVCTPPSGSFFPRGTTLVSCTATDASGNESTCEFPVTVRIKAGRRNL